MRKKSDFILAVIAVALGLMFLPERLPAQSPAASSTANTWSQHQIHDKDSDGLCDVCKQPVGSGKVNAQGQQAQKGKHWGPGDGTGNQGKGPKDGTGYGAQSGQQAGPRDGTGPHRSGAGQGGRKGRGGRGNS